MKRPWKYSLLFTFIILTVAVNFGQTPEGTIKSNLSSLFDLSKSKSFDKAAGLIAYEGSDATRVQKDSFNSSNKDEIAQVKRICKKIAALIELSTKYEFGQFSSTQNNEKEIFTLDVNFISGDQKLVTVFNFISTEKGFLLTNMN